MSVWSAALGLSVIGSIAGLLTASLLLLFREPARAHVVPWLVSYAVGTLLGAAVLSLLPEALEQLHPTTALGTMLGGIFTFFILEKLVLWRHSHDDSEHAHGHAHDNEAHRTTATLMLVGDAVHTFVDGAVIAASALVSLPLAVTTTVAAAAHEIPQEAGDFAILLAAGYSRGRALVLNLTSATAGLAGAAAMLAFGGQAPGAVPYVLAFAAGNFMYVAMADLIPHLHRGTMDRNAVRQIILIALGVLTIVTL
jgi:zinc and cadmium transporter